MHYCANCDAEAINIVEHTDDRDSSDTYLCETCSTAYEWGQTDPGASVSNIDSVLQENRGEE
jgi:protein-arginine kinase activator protein McsA